MLNADSGKRIHWEITRDVFFAGERYWVSHNNFIKIVVPMPSESP